MAKRERTKANAETMATKQRDISVSEFFAKNRHLLGFDNPRKALLTTVKEAVDNALDACEEASILPDIEVKIEEVEAATSTSKAGRYRVTVTDNGPGIVRKQIENIFGRLLYGSKFHRLKMSRGQQGIGISAAGMYGLMTTGKPMVITTRPKKSKPAHHLELAMDTSKNRPEVTVDIETDDFPATSSGTGTRVSIEMSAKFFRGKGSVETYLEQTAIANPHAEITFIPPDKAKEDPTLASAGKSESTNPEHEGGVASRESADSLAGASGSSGSGLSTEDIARTTELADRIIYPRVIDELPPETAEIKPHPYGVELGAFLTKLKTTDEKQLAGFFKNEFCRVPPAIVKEITEAASNKKKTITCQTYTSTLDHAAAERIYTALQDSKLRAPPTDCLAPIGVRTMLAGLLKGVRAEFYAASTRSPAVYRGNPFQIEAAIAFGGELPGDQPARVIRFANRVPLLYQQSACSSYKSVVETSWKNYGMSQPRGSAPVGPIVIMIHMASVWVPFTSESKEAIADYDEIRKEMRLALQECGRKLGTYIRRRQKMKREGQKRDVFERYIGEIAKACNAISGADPEELYDALMKQAKRRTEIADAMLDEDGQFVKDTSNGRLDGDDGVIIMRDDDDTPPSSTGFQPVSSNEPRPSGSGPNGEPRELKAPAGNKRTSRKPPTKKKLASKRTPPSKRVATRTPASSTTESKPAAIKNKGKPKPRVKLGEEVQASLFR